MRDNNIYSTIIKKLRETEEKYCVKIPLAIESGSRGWGFASPDSDYDCRFVYVRERDWYISVFDKPDIIEYAADKVFDVNGWDIRKFISHITKSNAVMFEWLSSNEIYIKDVQITELLQGLAVDFFNPISVSHHYLSLANKKYKEILEADEAKLKKYFYVLRPLANLSYVEQYGKQPYMEYFRTLAEVEVKKTVADEILRLVEMKKAADESFMIPKNTTLLDYFADELDRHEERLKTLTFDKNRYREQADVLFRKIIELVWNNG
jgi:predicted nucleotidyltransferase